MDLQPAGGTVASSTQTLTLDEYYRTLVGDIGLQTGNAASDREFNQTQLDNLTQLRDSVSGVNLDEELTEMIQLQSVYKAAAKLVTSADELLDTLLHMT